MLSYHKVFLEQIKKEVKASFVGYLQDKGKYYIRVILNKVKSDFEVVGTPENATQESYEQIKATIKKYYET